MTTATIMIGKRDYPLAPLVFDQMERVWPFLQAHAEELNKGQPEEAPELSVTEAAQKELQSSKDAIQIIAVSLLGSDLDGASLADTPLQLPVELTVPEKQDPRIIEKRQEWLSAKIRKTMIAGEIPLMRFSIVNLLNDSGLSKLGNVQAEVDQFLAGLQEKDLMETLMK
jgi:hypothetical protein